MTDEMLTTRDLAQKLKLQEQTVRAMRWRGDGPPFHRVGRRILYSEADVTAWLARRRVTRDGDAA